MGSGMGNREISKGIERLTLHLSTHVQYKAIMVEAGKLKPYPSHIIDKRLLDP
jgi:hypothetical protein